MPPGLHNKHVLPKISTGKGKCQSPTLAFEQRWIAASWWNVTQTKSVEAG